jgi:hypothetical protein
MEQGAALPDLSRFVTVDWIKRAGGGLAARSDRSTMGNGCQRSAGSGRPDFRQPIGFPLRNYWAPTSSWVGGLGASTILPSTMVIANWFGERRGTALGLATAGMEFGGMTMLCGYVRRAAKPDLGRAHIDRGFPAADGFGRKLPPLKPLLSRLRAAGGWSSTRLFGRVRFG